MKEQATVECFAVYSDIENGVEHIVRRTFLGDDHGEAAERTVASLVGSRVRIRELLTFYGPPRRWGPTYSAKELT